MEKYKPSSVRNFKNEDGRTLEDINIPKQTDVVEELKLSNQQVNKKNKLPAKISENKNMKVKKLKVKISRGEKRKLSEKLDLKKNKRKKKEEKSRVSESSSINNINKEANIMEILLNENNSSFTPQCKLEFKIDSPATENGSDMENNKKPAKHKTTKKNEAIAGKCKETLDILLGLNLEVLNSMEKSLKLIKSLSLLNNKYISLDVLLDLISLAVDMSKTTEILESKKELSLSMIITKLSKSTNKLDLTPKRSKARQSITAVPISPQNKSLVQEEALLTTISEEDTLENQIAKNQDEEKMELSESIEDGEVPEKTGEFSVQKSGTNFCITNYFKKLKRTVEEKDKNERFSCFSAKTDMFLAPKLGGELIGERRQKFEMEFDLQNYEFNSVVEHIRKYILDKKSHKFDQQDGTKCDAEGTKKLSSHDVVEEVLKNFSADETKDFDIAKPDSVVRKHVSLIRVDKAKIEPMETLCRTKAKLFQFHDNRRPPYWGTWRKKSESVKPRRPFGKEKMFNYEIDSDDEWEEEEEPGESLQGSEDEKEPEEDYEVDNEFFVPHGYLSDDENPEKENLSPKTKLNLLEEQFTLEQKQKMRKMTPIVFGTFWEHKGLPSEGNLYQDLQIDKLHYFPWTTVPVEIEEEDNVKKCDNFLDEEEAIRQIKKYKQKIFPNEEIPNLIKMIHGSPENSDHLARKFLLYWKTEKNLNENRPGLTKICVQKKIKELAAWQQSHEKGKMCWQVPMETRKEFGAEVENKTPEKKPRKCFIWKFVRKAEKNPLPGVENPPTPAPVVEPEIVKLES